MVFFLVLLICAIALIVIGAAVDGMLYLLSTGVLLLTPPCCTCSCAWYRARADARPTDARWWMADRRSTCARRRGLDGSLLLC
ncbi:MULTISPECIES: hypothetical protein [Streptomyces]|uniref:Secreted protein n=1 Tax=Streptomyces plumbiresistens TaxID=511811 RepID=A0ABP7RU06_9ACTN